MGWHSLEHWILADKMKFLVFVFLFDFTFCVPLADEGNDRFLGIFFPQETTKTPTTTTLPTTQPPNETTTKKQTLIESIIDFLFGVEILPATTSSSATSPITTATTLTSTTTTSTTTMTPTTSTGLIL